jgi:hypothetical protein
MRGLPTLLLVLAASLPSLVAAAGFSPMPAVARMTDATKAAVPFDLVTLKRNWKQRIALMRAAGVMTWICRRWRATWTRMAWR